MYLNKINLALLKTKYLNKLSFSVGGAFGFSPLDLFKNGEQGVWYDPTDLATMYQTSSGTPVTADGQPVGLVLDKSQDGALGSELITNGDFSDGLTGWNSGSGATLSVDNGQLNISADNDFNFYTRKTLNLTPNKAYSVTLDVAGGTTTEAKVSLYGTGLILTINPLQAGVYTSVFVAGSIAGPYIDIVNGINNGVGDTLIINSISIKEVLGIHASQPVATQRPTYNDNPDRLTLDGVDDSLEFTVPTGGIDGYMVVGTNDGTASYGVSLPAGSYELGGDYFPSNTINGFLLREGAVSKSDLSKVEKDFVSKGAKASYGDVTSFNSFWRDKNITKFPLIDTSSGTNFSRAWERNNLTSFPLINTSNVTNFSDAWARNDLASFPLIDTSSGNQFGYTWQSNQLTSFPALDLSNGDYFRATWRGNPLVNFPANMFDNCGATKFDQAFAGTNLSQQSIDGILVSIESNGTSNGTFDQSGGSAPSSVGESAITALRARGWTITVTGGF